MQCRNDNRFCRYFAFRIGKIHSPYYNCTEFSVQKIPTQHGNAKHLEGDYKHHETHVKSS